MKAEFDLLAYFYGYIAKLIETQITSLELNQAAAKVIDGDYNNYDAILDLSFQMNRNILDIMQSRKALSTYYNVYNEYVN